ncbi:MAG: FprA family A-type flavoprotein, partial [Lachnospiraceae bacterium]
MEITKDIKYVGVNDHQVDLFEGQYVVKNGMSYNSYVILDEKTAVLDTIDQHFTDEWLSNIAAILGDKAPDYLVVHHMEPDHSASIDDFMKKYPETVIVSSDKAFKMMKGYFGTDYADRQMLVKDGGTLELGRHTLTFVAAPNVHWPEVMVSYDSCDKVLFSADAFGKFGALDVDEPWIDEARRYYIGIVGKFGKFAQKLLAKAAGLDIQIICALHGPILKENLGYYIGLYDAWSSYRPEAEGVVVAYTSVYGHTKKAALMLADKLRAKGKEVAVYDLARDDNSQAMADVYRYSKV